MIPKKGMRAWLEEQKITWECPDCQTNFSWYQRECAQCGKNLDALKDYNRLDNYPGHFTPVYIVCNS